MLKTEGIHVDTVRVHEIWDQDGLLYIKIENNETGKVGTISQRIDVEYFLWTLISYDYLVDQFLFKSENKGTEIEFIL